MSESKENTGMRVRGFNPAYAGKRAECDGGGPIDGTRLAGRQDYAGTLTGEYVDHREGSAPPWRWYLMKDLTLKPQNCEDEAIWCLEGNLYLLDE